MPFDGVNSSPRTNGIRVWSIRMRSAPSPKTPVILRLDAQGPGVLCGDLLLTEDIGDEGQRVVPGNPY